MGVICEFNIWSIRYLYNCRLDRQYRVITNRVMSKPDCIILCLFLFVRYFQSYTSRDILQMKHNHGLHNEIYTIVGHALLCGPCNRIIQFISLYFQTVSIMLKQLYDCINTSEVTLADMEETGCYLNATKCNVAQSMCILPEEYCMPGAH